MSYCVIERKECGELGEITGSLLVYGRRKTGKTWLVQHCTSYDEYVLVSREGTCLIGGELREKDLSDCLERITNVVSNDGVVVVDEFQRIARKNWMDAVAHKLATGKGKLILLGSSYGVSDSIFSSNSPLLGLVEAYNVDLADPLDTIASLVKCGMDHVGAVRWLGIARDPWILGLVKPSGDPVDMLYRRAKQLAPIAPGLIGEIFAEEGRSLARIYDAILRLLAKGYWNTSQLAHRLYSSGLLERPAQTAVTGYIKNLENMGLVRGIRLWRTRGARVYYRHRSTLLAILYYILDRVDELGQKPSRESLRSRYYMELQFDLAELLAIIKKLRPAYSITPDGWDVDILLLDNKGSPQCGYEVKTGPLSSSEIKKTIERLRGLGIPRVGLISLHETPTELKGVDEVLGPIELVKLSGKTGRTGNSS
ncbi:MAG: AAA family ATPase [Desulfurococcales archaeon]|nr:AAA family ATPase [Desulfurococcales archaeon]